MILTCVSLLALGGAAGTSTAQGNESNYARAKKIIYALFPNDTQSAALRVVGCETGYTYEPWAYNQSGASGYFQVLTGNAGRILYYKWHTTGKYEKLRIEAYVKTKDGHVFNKLFNPWYNTKVALFLSHGGHDWGEWSCQP